MNDNPHPFSRLLPLLEEICTAGHARHIPAALRDHAQLSHARIRTAESERIRAELHGQYLQLSTTRHHGEVVHWVRLASPLGSCCGPFRLEWLALVVAPAARTTLEGLVFKVYGDASIPAGMQDTTLPPSGIPCRFQRDGARDIIAGATAVA